MVYITPFLWFDKEAREAAEFYCSIFQKSKIKNIDHLQDTPSGTVEIITLELLGKEYSFMSGGPFHKFNPSISYIFNTNTSESAEQTWNKLVQGATILMEFGTYPFAEKFGWLMDKFGFTWQIRYTSTIMDQSINPNLMFVGKVCGKAEEALNFYTSIFKNSSKGEITRFDEIDQPDEPGTIKFAEFVLEERSFSIQESAYDHQFFFNESMSFVINCSTQDDVDYYWEKLTADPTAEQCGWLKDKYGVSWQVVPTGLHEVMSDPDKEKVARKTKAFLKMKKIILRELEAIK